LTATVTPSGRPKVRFRVTADLMRPDKTAAAIATALKNALT
jgi:hypothetical protein